MKRMTLSLPVIAWLSSSVVAEEAPSRETLLSAVRSYRESHEHAIVRELFDLLSVPNTETDRPNMRRNGELLQNMLEERGIESRLIETPGNPIVFGQWNVPGATQTVAFYAHYDGVPVEPSQWTDSSPFEPVLRPGRLEAGALEPKPIPFPVPGESFGEDWRVYARSSSDDKSPIVALLAAFDAMRASRIATPNNLKFVFEGEEEYGSKHFAPFARENPDLLRSDVLFICDGPLYYSGEPTLWYGVRGSAYVDLTVYGPAVDLHSGHFGNFAPNPILRMARLLASMKDESGRVTMEGFYDTAEALTAYEQEALSKVPRLDEETQKLYGFAEAERTDLRHMESIQIPGLSFLGIQSAGVGEQARTIIPASATASLGIHLVKGTEPDDMVQKLVRHIQKQGYHVVDEAPDLTERMQNPLIAKVSLKRSLLASRTPMDLPVSRRVIAALTESLGKEPLLIPSMGSGIGIFYVLHDVLGIPVIFAPIVQPDNNQHGPNENLRLGNLWTGIETYAALMLLKQRDEP